MSLLSEAWAPDDPVMAQPMLLVARDTNPANASRPPIYTAVGLILAIASGLFIGTSFVLKKVGLLKANVKYNEEAGEGYGYLKNAYWWSGMTLMIIGEICNFVAYAFVDAILVTPMGALSVVVTTILSAIFLKERLSFVGKIGCFICIVGAVIIGLNAPSESSVANIQQMQHYVVTPGFLTWTGIIVVGCAFVALWVGPRYGKRTMLVYLSVCSLIGGLSVVATQGLGAAIIAQIGGTPQFNQWFLYVVLVFVIATLLTEIIYLNKALNLFNAALVTPTYYVFFTSATIITSIVLFQGFQGSAKQIVTIIMGFLVICSGVILLQLSKSAKDVPDTAVLKGDLDQIRTVGEQEQPESEPKADAIRGTAALIRRISQSRQRMEADEARRVYEEKLRDRMEPIAENERVEWDGLRRRKTIVEDSPDAPDLQRRKTQHPPLGLTRFPSYHEDEDIEFDARNRTDSNRSHSGVPLGFLNSLRRRASGSRRTTSSSRITVNPGILSPRPRDASGSQSAADVAAGTSTIKALDAGHTEATELRHVFGLPPDLQVRRRSTSPRPPVSEGHGRPIVWAVDADEPRRPRMPSTGPHSAHSTFGGRQFSFQNVFHRNRNEGSPRTEPASSPHLFSARSPTKVRKSYGHLATDMATEEERLGLVKGDSNTSGRLDPGFGPLETILSQSSQEPLFGRSSHEQTDDIEYDSNGNAIATRGPSLDRLRSVSDHVLSSSARQAPSDGLGVLLGHDTEPQPGHHPGWSDSSPELTITAPLDDDTSYHAPSQSTNRTNALASSSAHASAQPPLIPSAPTRPLLPGSSLSSPNVASSTVRAVPSPAAAAHGASSTTAGALGSGNNPASNAVAQPQSSSESQQDPAATQRALSWDIGQDEVLNSK